MLNIAARPRRLSSQVRRLGDKPIGASPSKSKSSRCGGRIKMSTPCHIVYDDGYNRTGNTSAPNPNTTNNGTMLIGMNDVTMAGRHAMHGDFAVEVDVMHKRVAWIDHATQYLEPRRAVCNVTERAVGDAS